MENKFFLFILLYIWKICINLNLYKEIVINMFIYFLVIFLFKKVNYNSIILVLFDMVNKE